MKDLLPWQVRRKIKNDFLKLMPRELWDIIFSFIGMERYKYDLYFENNFTFYGQTLCLHCKGKRYSKIRYDRICEACIYFFTKNFYAKKDLLDV